jgi:predicted lysophospholipase L1 biosynthesis ABC-type transport system permease subunit
MNRAELVEYLKTASDVEVEENITAGPGDGMSFRYSAAVAERDRRKQKSEWDKWSADIFQRVQAHDDAMKVARDQLDHQKKVSLISTIVAVVAALAAVASAVASFLGRQ